MFFGSHKSLYELTKEKGDEKTGTVRVSMYDRNIVSICDKDMLKELLVVKGNNFVKQSRLYEIFNTFGVNILSALDASGETWKNHHKVASGAFASKNLEYMARVASKSVDLCRSSKWDKLIRDSPTKSFVLDANGDFSDITLDVLGKAGFGLDFSIFDELNPEGKIFRRALETMFTKGIIAKRFVGLNPVLSWAYPLVCKVLGIDQAVSIVSNKLDEIIKDRTQEVEKRGLEDDGNDTTAEELEDRKDLLSVLVEANFIQKGILTDAELKSDAYIFSLAGHETTSTTLQWVCYELSKRPEVQKKAREEVDTILGKGTNARAPDYNDYPIMNYVNAVIMEALRLHPPVTNVFRVAKKTTTIGNITIPKDTNVLINIFSANRSENNWEKPLEFIPERYPLNADEQLKIQHDFTWIPFSMGNRKCIGFKFAQIEAFVILCRILQFYELELGNDESNPNDQIHDVPGVTVRPGNLKVIMKPRQDL
ncbi:hypothetical protein C9374_001718 [Naegleria lovaniensis]|uniref:Cytochrome P450 n=1 Tax=Naegleria lovaniensis TaxID=51637 RepID=A0AA88KNA8_NAELO|nr:uncharacterized protein C9374_001718 [Naegleria lovaniensis]KAG2387386.1 hypothetical protein C9374_001718 [Naegleria lovaniensis]